MLLLRRKGKMDLGGKLSVCPVTPFIKILFKSSFGKSWYYFAFLFLIRKYNSATWELWQP